MRAHLRPCSGATQFKTHVEYLNITHRGKPRALASVSEGKFIDNVDNGG